MNRQTFTTGDIHAHNLAIGDYNDVGVSGRLPAREWEPDRHPADPVFGIVTALPEEFAAMRVLLDDPDEAHHVRDDRATYVNGTLPSRDDERPHRVVLTLLGETGNNAAAESCANLARSFPSVDTVIMTGIACGVPNPHLPARHVRLGDIVAASWGVADYDHVVETDEGSRPRQPFPPPSPMLVRLAKYLMAGEISGERPWEKWIDVALDALSGYARPDDGSDLVYSADDGDSIVPHPPVEFSGHRPGRPKVHYGRIGSADRSLRSARFRDEAAHAEDLIAFEMEGKGIGNAGFANGLGWFVVRGISDYGDRRTGPRWRGYASVVAAAYTRALLAECPPLDPRGGHPVGHGDRSR